MAERISTPSKTKEIIEANRFAFKKNFGQNFLIDSNILDNIAACAGVTKQDRSVRSLWKNLRKKFLVT